MSSPPPATIERTFESKEVDYVRPKNPKQTSPKAASKAAKILRNPRSSKTARSVAGSDLAQTRPKTKGIRC